jgi:hypothetical protein
MNSTLDAIVIDNDYIIHDLWQFAAKRYGKTIVLFYNPEEFLVYCSNETVDRAVTIYIDSNLSNNVKGEVFAKTIYDLGYVSIYLMTGEEKHNLTHYHWLKGIQGKMPPWQ